MKDLDFIAENYHNCEMSDQWIENAAQEFELDWILNSIDTESPTIDLGWGDGICAPKIARVSSSYFLIEGSHALAAEAGSVLAEYGNAVVHRAMFESWSPRSTDLAGTIVASHVLEHVDDPVALLGRMKSWLKPGGTIVGLVPNARSIHRLVGVLTGAATSPYELSERDHMVGHQRVFDLQSLTEVFDRSGFRVEETKGFFLKPSNNARLLDLPRNHVLALVTLGDLVGPEHAANIAFRISPM